MSPPPYGVVSVKALPVATAGIWSAAPLSKGAGVTLRSLTYAVVEAVGLAPRIFLDLLPSYLKAKREYQHAVIAGFK